MWTPMRELAVTAVGADRPGIVAAITGALLRIGGNLEDVRAALLRGSFATVLAVAVPDDVTAADVAAALRPVGEELGLGIWVGDAAPKAPALPGRGASSRSTAPTIRASSTGSRARSPSGAPT